MKPNSISIFWLLLLLLLAVCISLSKQQDDNKTTIVLDKDGGKLLEKGTEIALGDGDHHHHHGDKDHHHHHHGDHDGGHHHHHHDETTHHPHHHHETTHHHHHKTTHHPHHPQDESCNLGDLLPGLDTMQQGVDLSSLDFFPMGEKSSNEANGHRESVFSYACKHGRKWSNPSLKNGKVYSLPDEVQDVRKVPSALMQASVDISSSLHDTKKSLEVQAGIGGSCKGIGFSVSGAYKTAKENMLKKNKTVTLVLLNLII